MTDIPDTILSQIVTYFETRELFSIWNNICKKSLRIGVKPQSIQHWNVPPISSKLQEISKFEIFPLLSNLKNIKYNLYCNLKQFPGQVEHWNRIDIDNFSVLHDDGGSDFSVRELILRDADGYCDLDVIEGVRHCLKRLAIVHGIHHMVDRSWIESMISDGVEGQKDDVIKNEQDIFELLQMIIPLSKKNYKIAKKIFKEKTKIFLSNENFVFNTLPNGESSTFVTPYLTDKQIEMTTSDIKEKIESECDAYAFDHAEELCYYDENNNIIVKNEGINPIEMLEFDGCRVYLTDEQQRFVWNYYLRDSHSRILNGLPHLKSLAFCGYQDLFFPLVVQSILNSIGNELLSLHLCDCSDLWNTNLHFYKQIKKIVDNNEAFDDKLVKK